MIKMTIDAKEYYTMKHGENSVEYIEFLENKVKELEKVNTLPSYPNNLNPDYWYTGNAVGTQLDIINSGPTITPDSPPMFTPSFASL